jgi:hypothetical protein
MSDELLDRFDIVGVDPRGVGAGQNVRCFASAAEQAPEAARLGDLFPVAKAEQQAYVKGAERYGKACSTTGMPLSGAMCAEAPEPFAEPGPTFAERRGKQLPPFR